MKTKEIAQKIKELRARKGISQELLAEESGLSLRTIQRIENGETDPRGHTLQQLAKVLNTSTEELTHWNLSEDSRYLKILNLSSLTFLLFPILGIIIPLILWVSKKGEVKDLDSVGKKVLNFQILWTLIVFLTYLYFVGSLYYRIYQAGDISPAIMGNPITKWATFGFLYLYNLILIIINTIKIGEGKQIKYVPSIKIIR